MTDKVGANEAVMLELRLALEQALRERDAAVKKVMLLRALVRRKRSLESAAWRAYERLLARQSEKRGPKAQKRASTKPTNALTRALWGKPRGRPKNLAREQSIAFLLGWVNERPHLKDVDALRSLVREGWPHSPRRQREELKRAQKLVSEGRRKSENPTN